MSKVNIDKFELNKPSELCQIVCFDKRKNLTGELTAVQMDIMNLLLYKSREKIVNNNISQIDEFFNIDIELNTLHTLLEKNKNFDYKSTVDQLIKLQKHQFVINALGKNKDMEITVTSFIHKIKFSRHQDKIKKNAQIILDGEIIGMILNTKKYFSKMFLKIQLSMKSKYSKSLYEILKDYENIKTIEIEFQMLMALLNVDISKPSNTAWHTFRPNILEKAILEINDKTDIKISYDVIKEKREITNKLEVSKIKFHIEKQTASRIKALGIHQESITNHSWYNKAKTKLDKLVKGGYNVIDEEMWIETDIKKNGERYETENRIDIWLKETNTYDKNELFEKIASSLADCDDPLVIIEDYKIVGLYSKEIFTKNPAETIELLNGVISTI